MVDFGEFHSDRFLPDFYDPCLIKIPIVAQALFVLRHACEGKGIKLTATRRLGRLFVQNFWEEHLRPYEEHSFKPYNLDDCPELVKVFFLLEEAKLVKHVGGHVQLSTKAKSILKAGNLVLLYETMLQKYLSVWNWACEDRYPDFDFIQDNALDLMISLIKWPTDHISPMDLFENNFEAEVSVQYPDGFPYESPEDHAIHCLKARFFDRFAIPFGLLKATSDDGFEFSIRKNYEKTNFFGDHIRVLDEGLH